MLSRGGLAQGKGFGSRKSSGYGLRAFMYHRVVHISQPLSVDAVTVNATVITGQIQGLRSCPHARKRGPAAQGLKRRCSQKARPRRHRIAGHDAVPNPSSWYIRFANQLFPFWHVLADSKKVQHVRASNRYPVQKSKAASLLWNQLLRFSKHGWADIARRSVRQHEYPPVQIPQLHQHLCVIGESAAMMPHIAAKIPSCSVEKRLRDLVQ
jgi:hypothetical protein